MNTAIRFAPNATDLTTNLSEYSEYLHGFNEDSRKSSLVIAYSILKMQDSKWLQPGIRQLVSEDTGIVFNEDFHRSFGDAVQLIADRVHNADSVTYEDILNLEMSEQEYRGLFIHPAEPLIAGQDISYSLFIRACK